MEMKESLHPGVAEIVNSYTFPGRSGPGCESPTGVLKTPVDWTLLPASPPSHCASDVGLPSSACGSRPCPRSGLPETNSGDLPLCTNQTPGEFGAGYAFPSEG